eukprot:6491121-Amphidinium_carterae.4
MIEVGWYWREGCKMSFNLSEGIYFAMCSVDKLSFCHARTGVKPDFVANLNVLAMWVASSLEVDKGRFQQCADG